MVVRGRAAREGSGYRSSSSTSGGGGSGGSSSNSSSNSSSSAGSSNSNSSSGSGSSSGSSGTSIWVLFFSPVIVHYWMSLPHFPPIGSSSHYTRIADNNNHNYK